MIALVTGVSGSCGCFGNVVRSDVDILSVGRNIGLAVLSYWASRYDNSMFSFDNYMGRVLGRGGRVDESV